MGWKGGLFYNGYEIGLRTDSKGWGCSGTLESFLERLQGDLLQTLRSLSEGLGGKGLHESGKQAAGCILVHAGGRGPS